MLKIIIRLLAWLEIKLIILYTIIPIGILVVYQHFSPAHHIINKLVGDFYQTGIVFMLALGIVRTTGTFTFTSGQSQYLAFLIKGSGR